MLEIRAVDLHGERERERERELCGTYAGRIRSYGMRHLRDRVLADDLVQLVLLAVVQALRAGRVEAVERLDAYVFGTARNICMDLRRGDARLRRVAEQAARELPASYLPAWEAVDRGRLQDCLGALEPRDRAVIIATFIEDRDSDEIGATLQLSAGNVRVIRHRALARLRDCVEGACA
jgi:RNA polymerase sigma-70 factor (ECF subfamily)